MRFALVGRGKMGCAVEACAIARGHEKVGTADDPGWKQSRADRFSDAEVAFEFTTPDEAESNVLGLLDRGISVVSGTTGWEPDQAMRRRVERAEVGFVHAPNFSIGVNLFFRVVRDAGRLFGRVGLHEAWIHEAHHRGKRDAPSGTARRLASILVSEDPRLDGVREGDASGVVPRNVLPVCSTRAGAEPGTHTVGFDGEHDAVTLRHRARGREGFALGAVLAGEWVRNKTGFFTFDEVLDEAIAAARPKGDRR